MNHSITAYKDDALTPKSQSGSGIEEKRDSVLVAEPTTRRVRPPMYKVVLLNDDFTPMEFVVFVLKQVFHKADEEAVRTMLDVHGQGSGICGVYTRDVAETKVEQVIALARKNEHPLQCVMERE
jgi:ATP-dependent Clp protease adaptor protein ClpS